jgi:hypothetical protein
VLGSAPLDGRGKAAMTIANLSAGTHRLTASYSGDAGDLASSSAAVAVAVARASTQITASASPGAPAAGKPVTFTAKVVSSAGDVLTTGVVTFKDGATMLGTASLTQGSVALKLASLSAGKHTITVSYGGDANHNSASLTISFTVKAAG